MNNNNNKKEYTEQNQFCILKYLELYDTFSLKGFSIFSLSNIFEPFISSMEMRMIIK
jgi:hypothetical protein